MRKLFLVSVLSLVMIFLGVGFIGAAEMDKEVAPGDFETVFDELDMGFENLISVLENDAGPVIGIGISVQFDEQIEIVKVYKNTPAEIVGMQEGDKIISVNGKTFYSYIEFKKEVVASAVPVRILKIEFMRGNEKMTVRTKARIIREDKTNEANLLIEKVKKEGNALLLHTRLAIDAANSGLPGQKMNEQTVKDANNTISNFLSWYSESHESIKNLLSIK